MGISMGDQWSNENNLGTCTIWSKKHFSIRIPLLYHQVSSSTNLYWPSTTKYQPVSPYTDPVLSSTNRYHCMIHHLIMYIWANWIFFLYLFDASRFHQVQFFFDFVTSNLPAPLGPPLKLRRKCLQLCSCPTLILDSYYFSSFSLTTKWEIA